jgi:hypothetical protein
LPFVKHQADPVLRNSSWRHPNLARPAIGAFARKIAAEKDKKMKQPVVVGIDRSWNHRRNGLAHVLDMGVLGNGRVADFEIVQKVNAPGPGNFQGNTNGMGVETQRWMVKRWADDQTIVVVMTHQDSTMAKVIRESRWNVRGEYGANYVKKAIV